MSCVNHTTWRGAPPRRSILFEPILPCRRPESNTPLPARRQHRETIHSDPKFFGAAPKIVIEFVRTC